MSFTLSENEEKWILKESNSQRVQYDLAEKYILKSMYAGLNVITL